MKRIIVTLLLFSRLAYADLDDTIAESCAKYGPPSATGSPQILVYTHPPFRIWQTYDNTGHCVIAEFSPLDHAAAFTAHDLAEMDCNNLPAGMIPGIGPGWERIKWHDNPRGRNTISYQYTDPDDGPGSSGSPVFNQYGLMIGVVSKGFEGGAELNFAISSNSIYEALELKTDDHPDGFNLGLTIGLEMRNSSEKDADIATANAERIEAENAKRAAAWPTEAEKLKAQHDEQVRADNERALKAAPTAGCCPAAMNTCRTPAKESTFRAELLSLPLPARIRRIDYQLAANRVALATRNEKLLGLRGDFDALTLDFWKAVGRGLGCEDPEREIAAQKERMHSVGHITVIVLTIAMTVLAALGARAIPELVVLIAVAGVVALCVIIAAPLRQIARAREVSVVLAREQEPFWLTGGNVALSNLGTTPPAEAKWWWPDRTALVFIRHLAVGFSVDATTGDLIWVNLPCTDPEALSPGRATQIFKDLLATNLRYQQMVTAFQGLAGLESDLTFLADLKAETERALTAELHEAEEHAAQLRRQAEDLRSTQHQEAQRKATEASRERPDPRQGVRVQSEPAKAQIERLTWNDLIIEDTLREKLETYCEILHAAEAFRQRGVTIPKGLLFYGPPGTGKTQTARVLAAESGCAFVGCTTADIKQGWIGHSGQKVKEIFAGARATAPTILFIDELEAITNDLDSSPDTITTELTAQLLQEIDGIQSHPQAVFLIGATNEPDRINRALFNRFTEKIEYPLPSSEQRTRLLDLLIGHRTLTPNTSRAELLEYLAGLSDGASGRDLRTMVERATIRAISRARGQGHPLEFALRAEDFSSDDGGEAR